MSKRSKQPADDKKAAKQEYLEYRKWAFHNLFENFNWKGLDKDTRRIRIKKAGIIALMAALSIMLYWFCFLDSSVSDNISVLVFLFYFMPVAVVSVLYGWNGGILCFAAVFLLAVCMSPSYAYFPFFHLIAIYMFSYINDRDICRNIRRTLLAGLFSGILMSLAYYLVFVLVTAESFSEITILGITKHMVNIVPQSVIICLFIYWFNRKCSISAKQKLGCPLSGSGNFLRMMRAGIKNRYRTVSGKIFTLFLIEAIIMGIAAALFSNSLIPRVLEQSMTDNASAVMPLPEFQAFPEPDGTNPPPEGEEPEGIFPGLFRPGEFTNAFEMARSHDPAIRFRFNDQGIAFDLKLIMMLLCVIHPIVLGFNFIGQRMIAAPIVKITDAVGGFGNDIDQRLEIESNLSGMEIHSRDEIEQLYNVVESMVTELNSYIDEMNRERKLEEDLRVAQAASDAKSAFLSNVSHEIRTPINAVLGLDEMIIRECTDENVLKYATDIRNSGKTLLALINDLLDFSKIEAGKLEIIPAEYELSSTVNDLINMVREKAEEKGLELIVDVAADTPHVLYGDEVRIKQCILNILNNAVKYTHTGSVRLIIGGRRKSDDEIYLSARVIDTGIGIKEEDMSRLFSPFERIEESRNRTIEGTGLGMSIVRSLLDMMGSTLEVSSVYGEGSDFSFEVIQRVISWEPIGDFNETYRNSVNSTEKYQVSFTAPDADILVVDDTPINLTVACGLLRPTLIRVDTASSGARCLEMIREKSYDLILMDQRMPEMDGIQTLHAMNALDPAENLCSRAPVIVLTANVVANAREDFLKEGFADYLSKPIDAVKFEKMIRQYLPQDKVMSAADIPEQYMAQKDDGFMRRLAEVDGIDADTALANCLNEDILKGAVHDFCVSLKTEPDKIEELWRTGNIGDYTIAVHALKSSARLIGALRLSDLAAELEKLGDAKSLEQIDEKTPALLEMYRGYNDRLPAVIAADEAASDTAKETIDHDALSEAYAAIREAAEAFDYDTADEIISMLKEYRVPDEESEKYTRVCDLVTRLDRDAILEEL